MRLQRPIFAGILGGLLALALAAPAHAGSVTTPNACLYSFDGFYRNQPVTLGGSGSPAGAAVGAEATLSGASVSARLPEWVPKSGYELGILTSGLNVIPARVWVAIAGANTTPATQVVALNATASTTITTTEEGAFVSGTPIDVTIPIDATTWTVAGEPVAFSQAGPGTLPPLPVGLNDAVVPVTGSIVIAPKLASLRFIMDCQPGSAPADGKSFSPAFASPFASLEAAAPVAPVPPPPPPSRVVPSQSKGKLKARVASTRLAIVGGRVRVVVTCPKGASTCKGRVALRSVAPLLAEGRRRILVVAPSARYSVAAGKRKTVQLKVGARVRALMRKRASLRVRVTLAPSSGAVVKRDLTMKR